MKYTYSYFVIKPDGIKYFPEIHKELSENFKNIRYYKIDDFSTIIKKLYFRNFEKKGQKLVDSFNQYLYASNSIYGNETILALVYDKDENDAQKFRDRVLETKIRIRDRFTNPDLGVITNDTSREPSNFVKIFDDEGNTIKQMKFNDKGNYRISFFNVIHCPDNNIQSTYEELMILCDSGILDESKLVSQDALEKLLCYKTTNGFQDKKDYMRPDVSTFLKYNIKMNDER